MRTRFAAGCLAICVLYPTLSPAQIVGLAPVATPSEAAQRAPSVQPSSLLPAASERPNPATGFWFPFAALPSDFARLFSTQTMKVVGLGGAAALTTHRWDDEGIEEAQQYFRPSMFRAGNIGGSMLAQAGASFGLYSVAKIMGASRLAVVGSDLVRAQLLTQGVVQAGKFATRRVRPDASNNHSLPSGHTASAFATATVLRDHFGWKVGAPAYAFGAYVAASRMSANKHHLSDVVLGATIGVAAGRTVTLGSGKARFSMGFSPTVGGAAVTFTRK